jgi:cation:H+ antiporter
MITFVLIGAGLALLAAGGELLVRGSAQLAARFGVAPLVVGLTVVAFGTSAPELAVSLQSVSAGAANVAIGNVVGSNIFNVLFILGASALLMPLVVSRRVVWVEVPIVIAISGLAWFFAGDGRVTPGEGLVLLLVVTVYTGWLLRTSTPQDAPAETTAIDGVRHGAVSSAMIALAGLALLLVGARWLVQGAVSLASALGVSDAVIGLTIVAAGTSLPEVAASLVATLRGQRDIAVGNVLGSNIFNLTVILGVTAIAAGGLAVPEGVVTFDVVIMVAAAVACLPIFVTGHLIARWEGGLFVTYYAAYIVYLVLDATEHDTLPHLRDAMVLFALPLTAVTLLVLMTRALLTRRRAGRDPTRPAG